jgi:bacterioferritin (cytochrome b1)
VPDDKMKVKKVIELMNKVIPLQFRSAAMFTWVAGTATGVEVQAVGMKLDEFGRLELDDARRLIEKTAGLGGAATTDVAPFQPSKLTKQGLGRIIKYEEETLDALHDIIPETGQEARSEALEHLLEHIIMRKQEQVDFLERVRRGAA